MPTADELYCGLKPDTVFDEALYKRIYGCSVTDPEYFRKVTERLVILGRDDAIQGYNEWFARWKAEDDAMMKEVAAWYVKQDFYSHRKEVTRQWSRQNEADQRRAELLTRKQQIIRQLLKPSLQQ